MYWLAAADLVLCTGVRERVLKISGT